MSDVPQGPAWWQASDGRWYPPEQFPTQTPPAATPSPVAPSPVAATLCTVGDIAVTADEVVTPSGRHPLSGTTWVVANNTVTTQAIPTWAVVMCVLTIWLCLFGLLFLLAKEERTTGHAQVSVQAPGFYHATVIPISMPAQLADVDGRVNYIRSLVAQQG